MVGTVRASGRMRRLAERGDPAVVERLISKSRDHQEIASGRRRDIGGTNAFGPKVFVSPMSRRRALAISWWFRLLEMSLSTTAGSPRSTRRCIRPEARTVRLMRLHAVRRLATFPFSRGPWKTTVRWKDPSSRGFIRRMAALTPSYGGIRHCSTFELKEALAYGKKEF